MTSNWGKKLEKKLNGLADSASKESIQTLANWVAFNRKHATIIATVLTGSLQGTRNINKNNNDTTTTTTSAINNQVKRQWLFQFAYLHRDLLHICQTKQQGSCNIFIILLFIGTKLF